MWLLALLSAIFTTIGDTIKGTVTGLAEDKARLRYETIDWDNIESVTFDGTKTAYRTEEEEEFDPIATDYFTQLDGYAHYETQTVEYEVEDGLNYLFTIKYKDGTTIYRKFHEESSLTERLLEYCNKSNNSGIFGTLFDTLDELDKTVTAMENAVDRELIIEGYNPKDFEQDIEDEEDDEIQSTDRFAVIDFETTGLNYNFRRPPMDEIISVSIIDQDENVLLDTYCDTVKIKSWYGAQKVNGISPRDVKGCPTFVELLPKVIEILSSYNYVIAYNVPFEKSFIENYASLYTPTDFSVYQINWGRDPMEMFMDYMGSRKFLKLETAAAYFGYSYNAHNSLEDTKAALYVYKALCDM